MGGYPAVAGCDDGIDSCGVELQRHESGIGDAVGRIGEGDAMIGCGPRYRYILCSVAVAGCDSYRYENV